MCDLYSRLWNAFFEYVKCGSWKFYLHYQLLNWTTHWLHHSLRKLSTIWNTSEIEILQNVCCPMDQKGLENLPSPEWFVCFDILRASLCPVYLFMSKIKGANRKGFLLVFLNRNRISPLSIIYGFSRACLCEMYALPRETNCDIQHSVYYTSQLDLWFSIKHVWYALGQNLSWFTGRLAKQYGFLILFRRIAWQNVTPNCS